MSGARSQLALRLRVADARDAGAVAAIYAPIVRDTVVSFELEPPDASEMERRIAVTRASHPWLVAEDGDGLAGYAYAAQHRSRAAYRWSADVSVYTAERARRQGVGGALYAALLALLDDQGFHRIYAGITLPNAASVALHEAHGFAFVGRYRQVGFKLGAWHDVGWWERVLATPSDPPEEPRALRNLLGTPVVEAALQRAASGLRGGC